MVNEIEREKETKRERHTERQRQRYRESALKAYSYEDYLDVEICHC